MSPVQTEDDSLALDGDVSAELDQPLPLVVTTVKGQTDLPEHPLHGVVSVDDRLLIPATSLSPPSTSTSTSTSPSPVRTAHVLITNESVMKVTLRHGLFPIYFQNFLQCSYRCLVQ